MRAEANPRAVTHESRPDVLERARQRVEEAMADGCGRHPLSRPANSCTGRSAHFLSSEMPVG